MKNVTILMDTEGVHIRKCIGEFWTDIFVDAAWGLANYRDLYGSVKGIAWFSSYATLPCLSGGFSSAMIKLSQGEKCPTVDLEIDGAIVPIEAIDRLACYANTDEGPILASLEPGWGADARPLVMMVGAKPKVRPLLQHLAVAWLYEIQAR